MKIVRNPALSRASLPQWSTFDLLNSVPLRRLRMGGMVARILTQYGLTPTSDPKAVAVALTDFTSRTAIHSNPQVHPSGSTANLTVLPATKTWADFNAIFAGPGSGELSRAQEDTLWWAGKSSLTIFETLYGTIAANGTLGADGLLEEYAPGQWRIRDFATYRSVWCSYSNRVMEVLLGACFLYGATNHTNGHDQGLAYLPDIGWCSADPTYNETHRDASGNPLTIPQLHAMSMAETTASVVAVKSVGPSHDSEPWSVTVPGGDTTYFEASVHPVGMTVIGRNGVMAHTPAIVGNVDWAAWTKAPLADVYADYGVAAVPVGPDVRLVISLPYNLTPALQRKVGAGAWTAFAQRGDAAPTSGNLQYRIDPAVAHLSTCEVSP